MFRAYKNPLVSFNKALLLNPYEPEGGLREGGGLGWPVMKK